MPSVTRDGRVDRPGTRSRRSPAPPVAPVAPVPVSLRGERPEIAAIDPVFGGVFAAPGRFATPAQARAAQIAAARATAAAGGPNKGTIGDGLSGLTHGLSFGLVDLGGDKNSDRYRGGDLASMIPVTPMGAIRSGERVAGKLVFREAVEESGSAAKRAAERKVWTRTVQFQGKRVYERDDLINPRAAGPDGKTNLDRMKKGNSPLGADGEPIQHHHTTQMDDSPLAEMLKTVHRGPNDSVWHINQPPRDFPSGIDRDAFDAWRKRYWRDRAKAFELPDAG